MEEGENMVNVINTKDYSGSICSSMKTARSPVFRFRPTPQDQQKKLTNAYSDKAPLKTILFLDKEAEIAVYSTEGRALVFSSTQVAEKATRDSQGVNVLTSSPNLNSSTQPSSVILQ
jgi:DNA gyrase subunit A